MLLRYFSISRQKIFVVSAIIVITLSVIFVTDEVLIHLIGKYHNAVIASRYPAYAASKRITNSPTSIYITRTNSSISMTQAGLQRNSLLTILTVAGLITRDYIALMSHYNRRGSEEIGWKRE